MATGMTYIPLAVGAKQIRVLMLQPVAISEEDDDLVNGYLTTISLNEDNNDDGSNDDDDDYPYIPYETVSYVWDDPSLRASIRLDGGIVDIPRSAQNALRRFRWKTSERVVWIDSVCINQADLVERSQQVAMMAKIYRSGLRNLIYLGEEDDTTGAAAQSIHDLCNTEIHAEISRVGSLLKLFYDVHGNFQLSDWPLRTEVDEMALAGFYSKPWFHRLWVIQEAALAPKSTCYCGQVKMRLFGVLLAAQWLSYKSNFLQPDVWNGCEGRLNAARMFDFMPSIHTPIGSGEYRPDILALLDIARNAACSDPRDKVFAMLGLIKWSGSPSIPAELFPDYKRDLKDILTSAAAFAIREKEEDVTQKLLEDVSHRSDSDLHLDELPSWVPRWQREHDNDSDANRVNFENGMPLFYQMDWLPAQVSEVDLAVSSTVPYSRWILQGVKADTVELVYTTTSAKFEWRNFASDYLIPLQALYTEAHRYRLSDILEMLTWRKWANLDNICGEQMDEGVAFLERLLALLPSQNWDNRTSEIETAIFNGCNRRAIGKTESGRPALLPYIAKRGDIVVQFLEVNTPTILRPRGKYFEVIGQAYVDRLMAGEPLKDRNSSGEEMDIFPLM